MTVRAQIDGATPADLEGVFRLLESNQLPVEGLRDHWATTLVARHQGEVVGSAALEVYQEGALLRSVAVSSRLQRQGLGQQLTDAAIAFARELQIPVLYLFTTTAEHYFPRFGFERIERSNIPKSVQSSVEFTTACPSSATVMRKLL